MKYLELKLNCEALVWGRDKNRPNDLSDCLYTIQNKANQILAYSPMGVYTVGTKREKSLAPKFLR